MKRDVAGVMLEASEVIKRLHAENQESKERLEELWQLYIKQLDINDQQQKKIDMMRDDIKELKEKLLEEQWKNADADIR